MTRLQAAAIGAVLVLAVAAGAVLALRPGARPPVSPRDAVRVHTTLGPRASLFGDRISAQADVLVDGSRVEPGSVRVRADFRPFETVAGAAVSSSVNGGVTRLRYRWALDCLARACLPRETARRVVFSPVRAEYAGGLATGIWPALRIDSRVGAQDLARPALRFDVLPLPSTSERVSAGTLRLLLLLGSGLAFLGAGGLLAPELLALLPSYRRVDRRTPLQRALDNVRAARERDAQPRRRALELLAREVGDDELEERIRELAWSPPSPPADEMQRVADQAEERA